MFFHILSSRRKIALGPRFFPSQWDIYIFLLLRCCYLSLPFPPNVDIPSLSSPSGRSLERTIPQFNSSLLMQYFHLPLFPFCSRHTLLNYFPSLSFHSKSSNPFAFYPFSGVGKRKNLLFLTHQNARHCLFLNRVSPESSSPPFFLSSCDTR